MTYPPSPKPFPKVGDKWRSTKTGTTYTITDVSRYWVSMDAYGGKFKAVCPQDIAEWREWAATDGERIETGTLYT